MINDWDLFLDDERYPPAARIWECNWKIARNVDDAMWFIKTYGVPRYMTLDHDLGYKKLSGMDFVKMFCDYVMDQEIQLADFEWYVHSQNPVGAENMKTYLETFMDGYYYEQTK